VDSLLEKLGELAIKNMFLIALIGPWLVVPLLIPGSAAVLVILVVYLVEAVVYGARRGTRR
jgi:hypothetical protein